MFAKTTGNCSIQKIKTLKNSNLPKLQEKQLQNF